MRFISAKLAPIVIGLIIMPVMITGLPLIVLLQKIPYENPQFWAIWRDSLSNVAPYAIPLALGTAVVARLIVGRLTILPTQPVEAMPSTRAAKAS
ncbi:MAG: hypothetical protein COB13_008050 [OCS116 cluster bacterium]|uniref:Uncharacterized protein n=1 Tax=OCS116 cluster bacterium TaxID=2030921 RepID=A0A2A4YUC4_9PROT|nr:hypothetical protein [OCS116 cluster bacterium]